MLLAPPLKQGDTIGIVSPSQPFKKEKQFELENFIEYMESIGLHVKLSENFYATDIYGASAGTPQQRADDINAMFADPGIHAIWCYQGGEPANQTLELLDFDLIKNNPKIILGKSDIDTLLLAINKKTGLVTFHGCDAKIGSNRELDFEYNKNWFTERFFNKSKIFEPSEKWKCINPGNAKGVLLGCNVSVILKLAGTEYFPDFTDAILCIETYKAYPGRLITQLAQLEHLGVFEKISGIIIGSNHEFQGGQHTAEEIVKDTLKKYNLPILKTNEFGHYQPHAFLPIGATIALDATNATIEIIDDFLS